MPNMFFGILLLILIIILININNKNKNETEPFNKETNNITNSLLIDHNNTNLKDKPENVKYDYENGITDHEKQFLIEQEFGMNLATINYNKWINHIDENGNPVYLTTEQITGQPTIIVENKTRNTWEFNKPKISNPDGHIEINQGRKIRDIYDNSILDYKKLTPKKEMVENINYSNGASSLSFYTPDKWTYKDEKLENGGSSNGIFANDPSTTGSVAIF